MYELRSMYDTGLRCVRLGLRLLLSWVPLYLLAVRLPICFSMCRLLNLWLPHRLAGFRCCLAAAVARSRLRQSVRCTTATAGDMKSLGALASTAEEEKDRPTTRYGRRELQKLADLSRQLLWTSRGQTETAARHFRHTQVLQDTPREKKQRRSRSLFEDRVRQTLHLLLRVERLGNSAEQQQPETR